MRSIIFFTIFSILLFANCHEEVTLPDTNNEMVEGTITGPNPMMCPMPCCSGWFIDINGVSYHFLNFPEGSEFNASDIESYPVDVLLSYEDSDECWENSIVVLEIEAD